MVRASLRVGFGFGDGDGLDGVGRVGGVVGGGHRRVSIMSEYTDEYTDELWVYSVELSRDEVRGHMRNAHALHAWGHARDLI